MKIVTDNLDLAFLLDPHLQDQVNFDPPDVLVHQIRNYSLAIVSSFKVPLSVVSHVVAIRKARTDIPIIGVIKSDDLTVRSEVHTAFQRAGGDLLVCGREPLPVTGEEFTRELLACIDSLRKRSNVAPEVVRLPKAGLSIHLTRQEVLYQEEKITAITTLQFRLLAELARNVGYFCTNAELHQAVYGRRRTKGDDRSVANLLFRLRRTLEALSPGLSDVIETSRNSGYRLIDTPLSES